MNPAENNIIAFAPDRLIGSESSHEISHDRSHEISVVSSIEEDSIATSMESPAQVTHRFRSAHLVEAMDRLHSRLQTRLYSHRPQDGEHAEP